MVRVALVLLAFCLFWAQPSKAYWTGATSTPDCPNGHCSTIAQACQNFATFRGNTNLGPQSITTSRFNSPGQITVWCGNIYASGLTEHDPTQNTCQWQFGENFSPTGPGGCLPANQPPKNQGNQCTKVGNPIAPAIGNKYEQIVDFETAGPDKLTYVRHYNSQAQFYTSLGLGWRSNFDRRLLFVNYPNTTSINAYRADGQVISFRQASGVWSADADIDLKLQQVGTSSTWTLTDSDDNIETYALTSDNSGNTILNSVRTRSGYTQTLQYNTNNNLTSVNDSYNRQITFTYANGFVSTMTAPDGGVYTYVYAAANTAVPDRLQRVVYPGYNATTPAQNYLYEDAKLLYALTGIVDDSRTRQVRIQTDAARASGRQSVLVTGERTQVTGPASRAFDQIFRRPDLGPK